MSAEIPAHHAGNAGSAHSGIHPPNHHGVQRTLAHCCQVGFLLLNPRVSGPSIGYCDELISIPYLTPSVLTPVPLILQAIEPAICCSTGSPRRIWALWTRISECKSLYVYIRPDALNNMEVITWFFFPAGCQMHWDWSSTDFTACCSFSGMMMHQHGCLVILTVKQLDPWEQCLIFVFLLQYIPHLLPLVGTAFERFAVIMSVMVVWLYAFFLTVGGAYKNAAPKTQFHCRTDRSGLVGGAPW